MSPACNDSVFSSHNDIYAEPVESATKNCTTRFPAEVLDGGPRSKMIATIFNDFIPGTRSEHFVKSSGANGAGFVGWRTAGANELLAVAITAVYTIRG